MHTTDLILYGSIAGCESERERADEGDAPRRPPRVRVIASTQARASDGAVIMQDGWELDDYERNPIVLWAHDSWSLPVARAIETTVKPRPPRLEQMHEFDVEDPEAMRLWGKIQRGLINAVSVRWRPGTVEQQDIDGKPTVVFVRGHRLLEVSYVAIPADAGAVIKRADGAGLDLSAYLPPRPSAGTPRLDALEARLRTFK